jgi:hypothetical protein
MRGLAGHTLITWVSTKLGLGLREFLAGGPETIPYFRGKQRRAFDIAKQSIPDADSLAAPSNQVGLYGKAFRTRKTFI